MKNDDFVSRIETMINERRNTAANITNEIRGLESEINTLQEKIKSFTDVEDLRTYTELKNGLEIRENKLEMLKRKLHSETQPQGEEQINRIMNGFSSEKKKIDEFYADEMLTIIRKLAEKLAEADGKRNNLKALYDRWVQAYNVPAYHYQGYPVVDETAISPNVQKLLNSLKVLEKI